MHILGTHGQREFAVVLLSAILILDVVFEAFFKRR